MHPVVTVKPLVGALAYIYGVARVRTHSCVAQLLDMERQQFMQRAGRDVLNFEGRSVDYTVTWHGHSRIDPAKQFDVDLKTFQVTESKGVPARGQAGKDPAPLQETVQ